MSPALRASVLLALILSLLAPAAALADTFTVDPKDANGSCGGADKICPTIRSAVEAAAAGDTVSVLAGSYPEAVTIDKDIEIRGAGEVNITGSGTSDVVTISGDGVTLAAVSIVVPANAASAVEVTADAAGATLSGVIARRTNASSVDAATILVAGAARILQSSVAQAAGGAGTPALASTGTGGTVVSDSVLVSSTGPAAIFSGSEANQVLRSTLVATAAGADGVRVLSDSEGARKLVVDSSYLLGGANAAGLAAVSSGDAAGDITADLKHVTTTGSAKGVVLDATEAQAGPVGDPVGNITATVANSIVHGTSSADKHEPGALPLTQENAAKLTFTNSDINTTTGDGEIVKSGTSTTEDAALFGKNLHLRADAPVLDKGAAGISGSDKDVDGETRTNGAAPDLGADEFVNKPPTAVFGITDKNPRENQPVGFVSGSTDPEQDAGGGIVEWRWDFGDGVTETTKVGGVAHTYTRTGTFNVTLQVVDRQGAVSAVSPPQTVTVRDGQPPIVEITAPVNDARLKLTRSRGRKRRPRIIPLTILGTVRDASGVTSVEVSLLQTKRDRPKRKRRARRSQQAPAPTCWHYSGRVFAKKPCSSEIWLKPTIRGTVWALQTRRGFRLPPGLYEIRARATDAGGLMSGAFSTASKTLVKFRVRR